MQHGRHAGAALGLHLTHPLSNPLRLAPTPALSRPPMLRHTVPRSQWPPPCPLSCCHPLSTLPFPSAAFDKHSCPGFPIEALHDSRLPLSDALLIASASQALQHSDHTLMSYHGALRVPKPSRRVADSRNRRAIHLHLLLLDYFLVSASPSSAASRRQHRREPRHFDSDLS